MLAALLPALTYMGHWPAEMPVPGTSYYIGLSRSLRADGDAAHEHAQHCHGDSASCSDVPAAGGAGVAAVLAAGLAVIGALTLLKFASPWEALPRHNGVGGGPQPPPPRRFRAILPYATG